jgi:poly(3-hydroxyalkanoate) synthetase
MVLAQEEKDNSPGLGQKRSKEPEKKPEELFNYLEIGASCLWPFIFWHELEEKAAGSTIDRLKFLEVVERTQVDRPKPEWASKNRIVLQSKTMLLRDFSTGRNNGIPTLVVSPYAGHSSMIVDFQKGQSLVEELSNDGLGRVVATDWRSATDDMKNFVIDDYLTELDKAVDFLGGRVNLAGMCQGGWLSAMYTSRFPDKVNTLVLGGAPIDDSAGEGMVRDYAMNYPMEFFEELVATGGGLMRGDYLLLGFKSLHPDKQYVEKFVELYENIEDDTYVKKFEHFEKWYEYTINLPGRWYLQVVRELFKENRFFNGEFVGLGRKLSLGDVKCPVYLLVGESDDITPPAQVFNAEKKLGTKKNQIVKTVAKGGHIGLFMGSRTLRETWPKIAHWVKANSKH